MENELTLILNWILDSLSQVKCPKRSDMGKEEIYLKLQPLFSGNKLAGEVFKFMQRQISDRSMGLVTLEEVTGNEDFLFEVRGPGLYLKLTDHKTHTEQYFLFGPYNTPVSFIDQNGNIQEKS